MTDCSACLRDWMLSWIDPDFYAAIHHPTYSVQALSYGNYGMGSSKNTTILDTAPNSHRCVICLTTVNGVAPYLIALLIPFGHTRYICNIGTPRKRLTAIVIKTSSCHVQIASHSGYGYSLYSQGKTG